LYSWLSQAETSVWSVTLPKFNRSGVDAALELLAEQKIS
jgi:hypothetical protein